MTVDRRLTAALADAEMLVECGHWVHIRHHGGPVVVLDYGPVLSTGDHERALVTKCYELHPKGGVRSARYIHT